MKTASSNLTLVRVCLFAALIAALGLIPRIDIPIAAGVPITAQTLGVMLAGLVLGARAGALAVLLFLLVVALGMPFLAGGRGGLAVFVGPTTGFLLGWIPGAFITGWLGQSHEPVHGGLRFLRALAGALVGGVVTVYICGMLWLGLVVGLGWKAAMVATAVFVPGDVIKAVLAAALSISVREFATGKHGA